MMTKPPVFIHSLYRSGSTYLFNVFRRAGDQYWCYQEPENEWLLQLDEHPDVLLSVGGVDAQKANHPNIGNPYFWEFVQIKDALQGLFRAEFCFRDIFLEALTNTQHAYFKALIDHATATPVLQFCRSFGRAGALKEAFAGHHLHLWREPRSQWWSFKINDYFDAATQLIFEAASLPAVLADVKQRMAMSVPDFPTIHEARLHAEGHPLGWRESYFSFFALWLYSNIALEKISDVSVCIDLISTDETARDAFVSRCQSLDITAIDLSDCNVPHVRFSPSECAEYAAVEQEVRALFLAHYDDVEVQAAFGRMQLALGVQSGSVEAVDPHALQARKVVKRLTDAFSGVATSNDERYHALHARLLEVDGYAKSLSAALEIKDRHIVGLEARGASLVTEHDANTHHIAELEKQSGEFEFALQLKNDHIKAVEDALGIKDGYISSIEGYNRDLAHATEIQANHIHALENQIREFEYALEKTSQHAAHLESLIQTASVKSDET
jgi:hypothetical protein